MPFFDAQDFDFFADIYRMKDTATGLTVASNRLLNTATTFADGGAKSHPSIFEDAINFAGLWDGAAGKSDAALATFRAATAAKVISAWPSKSDRGQIGYASADGWARNPVITAAVGSITTVSADMPVGKLYRVTSLAGYGTHVATTDSSSVSDDASTPDGGRWYYHVIAISATGGNEQWKLDFADSSDNSVFADKDTVTLTDAGGPVAAVREITGTIRQHVRQELTLDATSGSITLLVFYVRD